jgi:hypothetical protein
MARKPKYLELDGKRYLWRDVLELRREQCAAFTEVRQLALFDLRDDARPEAHRRAAGRYQQPGLFDA